MVRYFLCFFISAFAFAQQTAKVDFTTLNAVISIDFDSRKVSGKVTYDFVVKSKIDTIRLDAKSMIFTNLKINNKSVDFTSNASELKLFKGFRKGKNQLTFDYAATPKQTMYFVGKDDNIQIWTQGQGKYTSHWLPSFDDMNEKLVFNISVSFNKEYQVISNGKIKNKDISGENIIWNYTMEKPMSSYLAMIAIGKFDKQTIIADSGMQSDLYYQPEDAMKYEPTYRYSKEIFDFLETEIGVKYPWGIYKQIPVRDFLYGGMENTTATTFTMDYVVDEIGFNDRNYINVNAHELAHQWFGDMITAKSGKHHWLQEGFATFYALLAEQELFGDDHFHWKLYEMAERLQQASKTDRTPLLNEKASSLTFYQKGAWALYFLREEIGKENFRKAVKSYLEKHAFKNVETEDFLSEIEKVSGVNTDEFRKTWLESPGFEVETAIALLKQNQFIKDYFDLLVLQDLPFAEKKDVLEKILKSDAYYPIREEAVFQLKSVPFEEKKELVLLALKTNEFNVRQAVANTTEKIPIENYTDFVSLLDDNSYVTKEIALNSLWSQFPEKQIELLEKSKNFVGMNDKNLRILWLTLALLTKEYNPDEKIKYYEELLDYTSAKFDSNVRQNAITNMLFVDPNDTNVLPVLVNATVHHKWQFTKFGRDKIRSLIKKEKYKTFYTELLAKLPENEQTQLKKLLTE